MDGRRKPNFRLSTHLPVARLAPTQRRPTAVGSVLQNLRPLSCPNIATAYNTLRPLGFIRSRFSYIDNLWRELGSSRATPWCWTGNVDRRPRAPTAIGRGECCYPLGGDRRQAEPWCARRNFDRPRSSGVADGLAGSSAVSLGVRSRMGRSSARRLRRQDPLKTDNARRRRSRRGYGIIRWQRQLKGPRADTFRTT
jgi:hypothetical protein